MWFCLQTWDTYDRNKVKLLATPGFFKRGADTYSNFLIFACGSVRVTGKFSIKSPPEKNPYTLPVTQKKRFHKTNFLSLDRSFGQFPGTLFPLAYVLTRLLFFTFLSSKADSFLKIPVVFGQVKYANASHKSMTKKLLQVLKTNHGQRKKALLFKDSLN